MVTSLSSLKESKSQWWIGNNFHTYILLQKGASPETLEAKFPSLIAKYLGPQVEKAFGVTYDNFLKAGAGGIGYQLQPLTSIHLHSHLEYELAPNSDIAYVYIFSAISFFLLIIACINYVNLTTARSAARAKEIGIRKVVGSGRMQVFCQFMAESVCITFISLVIAYTIAYATLPMFNSIAGKNIELSIFGNPVLLPAMLAVFLFVSLAAGSYPRCIFLPSSRYR